MAASTDKFFYAAPVWVGSIGAAGVSDNSTATIPLSSATGLTNGRAYAFAIDRVDGSGTKTPSKKEVCIGLLSGSDFINCSRGDEGTAQAHSAGAVVEILMTAAQWNRLIGGLLVEHAETGVHTSALVTTLKASSSEVTTGTSDVKIVTPKALKDAGIVAPTTPPVKASIAEINTGTDDAKFATAAGIKGSIYFNSPEGFLINGKIVPSVASNNLTVAIKGMDGNDPSATNPVYCRINGVIRSITAALSVTKNAGTNWFNSGATGFATNEMDYFVYLGYNATDGVVVGFARVPYGTQYDTFSATTTAADYCAISTITNAASTDYYSLVGRFAATLSATAAFNWSVPTFTAKNLIQKPIYESRWTTWTPTTTWNSTPPSTPTLRAKFKVRLDQVIFRVHQSNSGAGTTNTQVNVDPMPFNASDTSATYNYVVESLVSTADDGTAPTANSRGILNSSNASLYIFFASASAKSFWASGFYDIS